MPPAQCDFFNDVYFFLWTAILSIYLLPADIWEGIETTWRNLIMEAEVFDRSAELSILTGSNLDPKKAWYVLTKS